MESTPLRSLVARLLLKRSELEGYTRSVADVRQSLAHPESFADPLNYSGIEQALEQILAQMEAIQYEIRQLEEALHLTPGAPLPPLT
jgi:hypothetical protein